MKSTVIPITLSYGPAHVTVYFKDVKRLNLRVKNDKIIASVPRFTSLKTVESFINKNLGWIEERLNLESEKEVYILGKKHLINVSDGKNNVDLKDGEITVYSVGADETEAKKTLLNWWKRQFKAYILPITEQVYGEVKTAFSIADFPKITVCSAHSFWGKCFYTKNVIKISHYLFQADPETIKYVVYHEFCHLKYHGHDKDFYDALSFFYPDVKGAKKKLKEYRSKLWFDE